MRKFFVHAIFWRRDFGFAPIICVAAINFVQELSKSELSSRFLGRLKICVGWLKICRVWKVVTKKIEILVRRNWEFLSVTIKFVSKNHAISAEDQLAMILGERVKQSITIFGFDSWPKVTFTNRAAIPCAGGPTLRQSYLLDE